MAKRFVSFFALAFLASATANATITWLYPWRGVYVSPATTVTVNYDQTVDQLVHAVEYDEYEIDIPEFGKGPSMAAPEKKICHTVVFAPWLSFDEKIAALKESGLRPATFEELAAYSVENPEARKHRNLVALGSEWQGDSGRTYVAAIGSYVRPGAHQDEPVWVFYSDPPTYYKKGPNKGKRTTIPPSTLREPIEVLVRTILLVRRDYLWTDELDGEYVVLAVEDAAVEKDKDNSETQKEGNEHE